MKETLEERKPYWDLVDAKAEQNNTIDLDAYAKGVQDGAKWQQERMYSEEDMKQFAEWLIKVNFNYTSNISDVFLIWNKQFKKK
jgi:hypothetical protein